MQIDNSGYPPYLQGSSLQNSQVGNQVKIMAGSPQNLIQIVNSREGLVTGAGINQASVILAAP
jgi:hypothetical protein